MMTPQTDPPIMGELMEWCFGGVPSTIARQQRVPRLYEEFRDIINRKIPIITVAGTSGKGSTCALLEAVLLESGHVPGVYTKPHLFSFHERFRVGGHDVTDVELTRHTKVIFERLQAFVARNGLEYRPSLYEALILIASAMFAERGVTLAVFEAAVGGVSCATSYLPSILSVITSVDLDHQLELGFRIEDIAKDKAGIVPPGGTLVVGAGVSDAARRVVLVECENRNVRCVQASVDRVETLQAGVEGQTVRYDHRGERHSVFVPFPGHHQTLNFATVWQATQLLRELGYVKSLDSIRGVERAKIPGRFEIVRGSPSWLFDVAHNPASTESLIRTASQLLPQESFVGIVGATGRHDYSGIVNLLGRWGIPLGFCEGFPRALPARQLLGELSTANPVLGLFRTPAEVVEYCLNAKALAGSMVLVTGSLFLVGQCRHELARRGLMPQKVN